MKIVIFRTGSICLILMMMAIAISGGCEQFSETISDKTAGINGSFEHTKSGMPVNWLLYTPRTVPEGDFDILIDTTEFKDGKQSLKFLVRECSSIGGRYSPGLCKEYNAKPGEIYRVSFWVKNMGCEFIVHVGGVSAFTGEYEMIVRSKETIDVWQQYEHKYTIPKKMNALRIQVNILQPGSFWIDDIKIERVDDGSEGNS